MKKRLGVGFLGLLVTLLLVVGAGVAFGAGGSSSTNDIPFQTTPVKGPERPSAKTDPVQSISPSEPQSRGPGMLDWWSRNWGSVAATGFGLLLTYIIGDSLGGLRALKRGGWDSVKQGFRGLRDIHWWEEAKATVQIAWMSVQENAPVWWETTKDFSRGLGYEIANMAGWGVPDWLITGPMHRSLDDNSAAFKWGRAVGSIGAFALGIAEIIGGIGGGLGGGAAILLSGGAATPVALPVVIASPGLVVHGSGVAIAAAGNAPSRFREAIYYSKSIPGHDDVPPDMKAVDPEVVTPREPSWKRFQKRVTGRNDVAEYKGAVEINGKWRKVRLDDIRPGLDGQWKIVDAKDINFNKPFYKTAAGQNRSWNKWLEQLQAQQAWARKNNVNEIRWVFSQEPPPWLMKQLTQAVRRTRTLGSDIDIIFTVLEGGG